MSSKRYPEEFKIEAVRQVTDRGHSVAQVADRLGVTTHSLYAWIRKFGPDSEQHQANADDQSEIRRPERAQARYRRARHPKKPRRTSPVSPIEVRLHSGAASGQSAHCVLCWTFTPVAFTPGRDSLVQLVQSRTSACPV